jgi:hypothetical protein
VPVCVYVSLTYASSITARSPSDGHSQRLPKALIQWPRRTSPCNRVG